MIPVQRAEDAFAADVKAFPGLLAAFLYSDLDDTLQQFIQTHWDTLNVLSHNEILILVPEAKPTVREHPRLRVEPVRGLLRSFLGIGTRNWQNLAVEVSDHFGIKFAKFPCIIFFDHPTADQVYCFSFGHDVDVGGLARDIKRLLDTCREVVKQNGGWVNVSAEEDLKAIRADMLGALQPALRRLKIFRSVERLVLSKSVDNAIRIGRNLSGTF